MLVTRNFDNHFGRVLLKYLCKSKGIFLGPQIFDPLILRLSTKVDMIGNDELAPRFSGF